MEISTRNIGNLDYVKRWKFLEIFTFSRDTRKLIKFFIFIENSCVSVYVPIFRLFVEPIILKSWIYRFWLKYKKVNGDFFFPVFQNFSKTSNNFDKNIWETFRIRTSIIQNKFLLFTYVRKSHNLTLNKLITQQMSQFVCL